MGLFSNKVEAQAELDRLNNEIAELELKLDVKKKATQLEKELDVKKRELMAMEEKINKLEETHARALREVEHMTGLNKQKHDQELEHAKKTIELEIREGNLASEKALWQQQMDFEKQEFNRQRAGMEVLIQQVLDRLPNVNYNIEHQIGAKTDAPAPAAIEAPKPTRSRRTTKS